MSKIICAECSKIVLEKFGAYECIFGLNIDIVCDLCGKEADKKNSDFVREEMFEKIMKKIKTKTIKVNHKENCPFYCYYDSHGDVCILDRDYCCGIESSCCPLNDFSQLIVKLDKGEKDDSNLGS